MTRTQIYLSDKQAAALDRESGLSGRTKSQLIREAIDRTYLRETDTKSLLRALAKSQGAWRRRDDGEAYAERVRSGRLARLHGKTPE